jgi:Holliday junction resolvase
VASKVLESQVEAGLVRYAKKHGIYTRKFVSPSQRGVPDRIFVHGGLVLFLEIKRPGEEPTKLQLHELSLLESVGATATWVDTVTKGKAVLDAVFRLPLNPLHGVGCSCGCLML